MESFDYASQVEKNEGKDGSPVIAHRIGDTVKGLATHSASQSVKSPTGHSASSSIDLETLKVTKSDVPETVDEAPEDTVIYPQLTHEPIDSPKLGTQNRDSDEDDEDDEGFAASSRPLPRRATPSPEMLQRSRGATVHIAGDEGQLRMHRFTLYETQSTYYVFGSDMLRISYRILKINRNAAPGELDVIDDEIVYNQREVQDIVNAVDQGNRASGGLKVRTGEFWGILGFVKFTGAYYMVIVSKRSHVAVLGGHYIEKIDKTEMIQLTTTIASKAKSETYLEESRLLSIFGTVDLAKGFYFSRSYDITQTLQHNITREREALNEGNARPRAPDHNDMFIWNHHLLEPARVALKCVFDWCVAVTHGYIDQSALSIYWGRVVYITILARRSRHFAGARYLKRGANDLGYVANDVETEQIVSEMRTQSFHAPGPELYANPLYTSYVQHRGSIPLYWTQDPSGVSPKPDINLSVNDPFFTAAALHFDDLFKRYGTPVYVLNLIKQKERAPREGKLGAEYALALSYLNQFLPDEKRIVYKAFDMSRAAKSKDRDVIGELEEIAEEILTKTGFFMNGFHGRDRVKIQEGIARTNCIDCLDRTNAAQFLIGKKALGHQLQALGVIEGTVVEFDSDAVNMFTNMWHDHGDTIAIQYGGSHLVNTMSTYRKINQWTSHSRDMVESFKRFYNNSFLDAQRQESYNLFLGNYIYRNGHPLLWDLSSDYYLHHTEPRSTFGKQRPNYRKWYTPAYFHQPDVPPALWPIELSNHHLDFFDDYWSEYYRPLTLSSFRKIFAFKMHSNLTLVDLTAATQGGKYDLSPFKVRARKEEHIDGKEKSQNARKKGVKVIAPSEEDRSKGLNGSSIDARLAAALPDQKPKPQELGNWLDVQQQAQTLRRKYTGIIKDSSWERASHTPIVPAMPPANAHATEPSEPSKQEREALAFQKLVEDSLNPEAVELDEYEDYVSHPSLIPLVTTTETDYGNVPKEFVDFIARIQDAAPAAPYSSPFIDDLSMIPLTVDERAEQNIDEYQEYIDSGLRDDPLTVLDEDDTSKRYKKYRAWITRGKSLFKQKNYLGGELV